MIPDQIKQWLYNGSVRPYVFVREESHVPQPGAVHAINWFPHEVLYKNPLRMDELSFANRILDLETATFGPRNLQMPRWVFYDCAIMPGFVAGFAQKSSTLPKSIRTIFQEIDDEGWTPLSLFIIIPTMAPKEWVAHNLCSINALVNKSEQYYGLGFLSKAFGLWYANIEICCGMTQWMSPAIQLHALYGQFEILTAYTPIHSFAQTLTYRMKVESSKWQRFFTHDSDPQFLRDFEPSGIHINPTDEQALIALQTRLEKGEGPYFLDGVEVRTKKNHQQWTVYRHRT